MDSASTSNLEGSRKELRNSDPELETIPYRYQSTSPLTYMIFCLRLFIVFTKSIFLRGQSLDTEKMKRRSAGAILLNPRPPSLSHQFVIAWKKFRVQSQIHNLSKPGLKRWTVVWWWSRIVLGRWISRRGASPRWPAGRVVRLPAPGLRLKVVVVMIITAAPMIMHVSQQTRPRKQ